MDSRATDHVTADPSQLAIASTYQDTDQLQVGNDENFLISCTGQEPLEMASICCLRPSHLVPKLKDNDSHDDNIATVENKKFLNNNVDNVNCKSVHDTNASNGNSLKNQTNKVRAFLFFKLKETALPSLTVTGDDETLAKRKAIDDWLPITSSRNAKWWNSAFHNVTAIVGAGVLSLPYAMSKLGWGPGIAILVLSWIITLYTLWQMIEMHEMVPGRRFDRYQELGQYALGEKLGLYVVVPQVVVEVDVCVVSMVTRGKSLRGRLIGVF
ncbi:uncharacterized protein LOC123223947 [Mangifera indica]|uniref:uncharacterized protein LOC123223947 n=1 Tax=Mangifera indica TaxID=29780 RepID=UPI001CFBB0E4|nr:uncharacterized protein LOC123223947 [Mangifera indica]